VNTALVERHTPVVVDDHLALLAALGLPVMAEGVIGTPVTTSAWHLLMTARSQLPDDSFLCGE